MIRDEYNKSQAIRKRSAKEIEGVKKYGERAYYAITLKKLSSNVKAYNFNTIFVSGTGLFLLILLVVLLAFDFSLITKWYMIASIALVSIIFIWGIVWFLIVKKIMKSKIDKYQKIIDDIKTKEMEKQKSIYKIYSQTTKGEN
ncbi:MAG: hypothetical protein J6Q58_00660 [Clostridia bacterium]|nr:hypothetical protein [Clostridia bacterium]